MSQQPEPATASADSNADPFTVFSPDKREPDLRSMTRIMLRPIGSPMPLGFFTVAIDSVAQGVSLGAVNQNLGLTEEEASNVRS